MDMHNFTEALTADIKQRVDLAAKEIADELLQEYVKRLSEKLKYAATQAAIGINTIVSFDSPMRMIQIQIVQKGGK